MRLLIQRVSSASVTVLENTVGSISTGLVVYLGISKGDTNADANYLLDKLVNLRIFPDESGRMNRSIQDVGGALLVISQFTLYGDCRRGRRPSFDQAMPPAEAEAIYNYFVQSAKRGPVPVETGIFQAHMQVRLVNSGPVTIWIDSSERNRS